MKGHGNITITMFYVGNEVKMNQLPKQPYTDKIYKKLNLSCDYK